MVTPAVMGPPVMNCHATGAGRDRQGGQGTRSVTHGDHPVGRIHWTGEPGGAVAVAVGPNGLPWVTNSADQIYKA